MAETYIPTWYKQASGIEQGQTDPDPPEESDTENEKFITSGSAEQLKRSTRTRRPPIHYDASI